MSSRARLTATFAATILVVGVLAGTTSTAGAADENTTVALFYDPAYVDVGGPGEEATDLLAYFEDLGADVNLIEGIAEGDFSDALADANVLVFPEFEVSNTLGADMTQAARDVVADFVDIGGRVVFSGGFLDPTGPINAIFGTLLVWDGANACDGDDCEETADAGGTEFEGLGPLAENDQANSLTVSSLPSNALVPFQDPDTPDLAPVAVIPNGDGSLVFFGWDWNGGPPNDTQDGGWVDVMDAATTPIDVVLGESIAGATGETIVCPLTFGVGSQPIIVSWEGVFASDGETFTGDFTVDPNTETGIEGITTRPEGDMATLTITVDSPFARAANDNCTFTWTGTSPTPLQPLSPAAPATPVSSSPAFAG